MENRNLLESGISVELTNREARKEKKAIPPITKMHYYFTRKPLISSRIAVVGTLLDADSVKTNKELNNLLGLDPTLEKRAYKNIKISLLNKIKEKYPEKVTILDPFAGSGMIPFEALRLGLNVVAVDYNPVANLIMKGTLEYPLKFGAKKDNNGEIKLLKDLKNITNNIFFDLKQEMKEYYPEYNGKKPRAYFWCWAIKCPVCGKIIPLISDWRLDIKRKVSLTYEIKNNDINYKIIKTDKKLEGTVRRGKATCIICSIEIKNKYIVKEISKKQTELLLAIRLETNEYVLPTQKDHDAIKKADLYLKNNLDTLGKYIPTENINDESPTKKYLKYWYNLFNRRQLLFLTMFAQKIYDITKEIYKKDEEYAIAIGTYLTMIFGNHIRFNTRSAIWSIYGFIAHIFTVRRPSMMWEHPEVNPFIKHSGSLVNMIPNVINGLEFAINKLNPSNDIINIQKPKIEIINTSLLSWKTNKKFKFIITDLPYYNDVQFPELMQFFQVWYNRILGEFIDMPSIPSTSEELSVGINRDEKTFESRMFIAIRKIYNLLEDDGILVLFYVHKSTEGLKYVLESLRKTGFVVTSTITLMTEGKENVIARGKSSIFHSLLITARKRIEDKRANILDVEKEIRQKMEERYPDLERLYGKDRMNLIVAASGIVIETITKYSEITSFTKNTADYALEMGRRYLIEVFARNNLKLDNVDSKTMVYTWLRHSPIDEIDYSEFNQMLKALATSEESVSDIIYKAKGKRNKVRLRDFSDRGSLEIDGMEPLIATSLIDAVHIALRAYMRGGITAAKEKIDYSTFSNSDILNTIEALGRLHATKTGYSEGEVCAKFIEDWNALQLKPRKLTDWAERKESARERR